MFVWLGGIQGSSRRVVYLRSGWCSRSILPSSLSLQLQRAFGVFSEDFSPLLGLTNLKALGVTGDMWSKQRYPSLEVFSEMNWLSSLALDTPPPGVSIRPLGKLTNLQYLSLGGGLSLKDYAFLAVKLPVFASLTAYQKAISGLDVCDKCKQKTLVEPRLLSDPNSYGPAAAIDNTTPPKPKKTGAR